MAIEGTKKCPYCGSTNVSQTAESYAGHAVKGTVAAAAGAIGGTIVSAAKGFLGVNYGPSGASKIMNGILANGSYDFRCNRCGQTFLITFRNNTITDISCGDIGDMAYYKGADYLKKKFK